MTAGLKWPPALVNGGNVGTQNYARFKHADGMWMAIADDPLAVPAQHQAVAVTRDDVPLAGVRAADQDDVALRELPVDEIRERAAVQASANRHPFRGDERPHRRAGGSQALRVLSDHVVLDVPGGVLHGSDLEPAGPQDGNELLEKRGLAGVVSPHEGHERRPVVGIQKKRIAARQKLRRFLPVTRDLGQRPLPGVEVFPEAGGAREDVDRGPRIELVRLAAPPETLRRELADGRDDREASLEWAECGSVADHEHHPAAGLSGVFLEGRPEARGKEVDARKLPARERVGERERFEPGRSEKLEGAGRPAALGQLGALDQAHAGIGRAGIEASAALSQRLDGAGLSLDVLTAQLAEQERASQRLVADLETGLAALDSRFATLADQGDERAARERHAACEVEQSRFAFEESNVPKLEPRLIGPAGSSSWCAMGWASAKGSRTDSDLDSGWAAPGDL